MGGRGKSSGVQHQLSIQEQMFKNEISLIIRERNTAIFNDGINAQNASTSSGKVSGGKYVDNRACACCGSYTIPYDSELFVCPVCGWVDDAFQNLHPDSDNGPNIFSLNQMKENIKK
jgi:rubrerythrin